MTMNASETRHCVFTIGHSNRPPDTFVRLLQAQCIELLVDVRSHPYSKRAPHFAAQTLKTAVAAAGIQYVFLGAELGGRPQGEEFSDAEGYVLYSRVARSPLFLRGISRLETEVSKHRVAIMCSEENPVGCHRRLLIVRVLAERGINARHIRGNGKVQTETELTGKKASPSSGESQLALFDDQRMAPWKSIRPVLRREKRQLL